MCFLVEVSSHIDGAQLSPLLALLVKNEKKGGFYVGLGVVL